MTDRPQYHLSTENLAKVFTEWDRRYREEPERFMSEAQHLLKETPETYGDACAPYFVQLVKETLEPNTAADVEADSEPEVITH